MKRLLIVSILSYWGCNKITDDSSQVSVSSASPLISAKRASLGIYSLTDKNKGITIKYFPVYKGPDSDGRAAAAYRRYMFLKLNGIDSVVTEDFPRELKLEVNPSGNIDYSFNDGVNRNFLGTLGAKSNILIIDKNAKKEFGYTEISGIAEKQDDIFERELLNINDEIYLMPSIKWLSTERWGNSDVYSMSKLLTYKLEAILPSDNKRIILTARANCLNSWLLRNTPAGLPVFSKKTNKIIGFVRKYNVNELEILSVKSGDQEMIGFRNLTAKFPWPQESAKPSFSESWKESYCSPQHVKKVVDWRISIDQVRVKKKVPTSCVAPQTPGPTPPWDYPLKDAELCSKEKVFEAIARSFPNDKGLATDSSCQGVLEKQNPEWEFTDPKFMPQICRKEVEEAIAARILADKSCQGIKVNLSLD